MSEALSAENDRSRFAEIDIGHLEELRKLAMVYPECSEDHPWGECAFKVRKKVFIFVSLSVKGLSLSVKLPEGQLEALLLPFTEPTGYGMGKHGWVSAHFPLGQRPPMPIIAGWIEESYRAIAPNKLIAVLDAVQPSAQGQLRKKA